MLSVYHPFKGCTRLKHKKHAAQNAKIDMSNIASALKSEISRIARKEVRAETVALKKLSASQRHDVAALKKRVQGLERQVKQGTRRAAPVHVEVDKAPDHQLRFSAARFAAQRQKLGLSAASFAKLLGVSALSVYKWERGQNRPRRAQLEAIAAARKLGKRESWALLEQLS
jgi:DNA-binding transcriptional regulator YiaG